MSMLLIFHSKLKYLSAERKQSANKNNAFKNGTKPIPAFNNIEPVEMKPIMGNTIFSNTTKYFINTFRCQICLVFHIIYHHKEEMCSLLNYKQLLLLLYLLQNNEINITESYLNLFIFGFN